jgi:hypothetical protein
MPLIPSNTTRRLSIEVLLEPASCGPVRALRKKYGRLPKLPSNPLWSACPLVSHLPSSPLQIYRDSIATITANQSPFEIAISSPVRSFSYQLNQMGFKLSSPQLADIHARLVKELKDPVTVCFRKLHIASVEQQMGILERIFKDYYHPRVGVKYGCSDEDAERTLEELKTECRGGLGILKAVEISLRELRRPDEQWERSGLEEHFPFLGGERRIWGGCMMQAGSGSTLYRTSIREFVAILSHL